MIRFIEEKKWDTETPLSFLEEAAHEGDVNTAFYSIMGSTDRQTSMPQQRSINKLLSKDMRMLNIC